MRTVLVLNHYALPSHRSGSTRHLELFGQIRKWNTRVIAADHPFAGKGWSGIDGILVTVPSIPYRRNNFLRVLNWCSYAVAAFMRGLFTARVDIVYASSPHLLTGLTGLCIARLRRVPLILEIRDIWPLALVEMGGLTGQSIVFRLLRRLELFLYKSSHHIVYLASGTREYLIGLGIAEAHITFLPNGVDPERFRVDQCKEILRNRFGFQGLVAIYAGAHGPANGLEYVLQAANALSGLKNLTIVLIGDGVDKPKLRELSHQLDLENVRFMEPVSSQEIPLVLRASDIGIHCLADVPVFRTSVSPNKIFDYMAAGLPIVTNSPGVCADEVTASGCGVCVQPDGLAGGLTELIGLTDQERASLGSAGNTYVRLNRSRDVLGQQLEEILDSVLATQR